MRPGYLYFTLFTWFVATGGRWTAPFLKEVAMFDDSIIGILIALHVLLTSFLGSIGAVYADKLEFWYPNKGRIGCMIFGLITSTIAFEIHYVVHFFATIEEQPTVFFGIHIVARILYAICSSFIYNVLDGITLSYTKKHNADGSASYGKERLFGAVGWAIASILLGPILDATGFSVFFLCAPICCIISCLTMIKFGQECIAYEKISEENITANKETEMVKRTEIVPEEDSDDFREDGVENPSPNRGSLFLFRAMVSTYTFCGFIFSSLTLKIGTSVVESLIFLYFESMGGSNAICGLTVVVTVVFEIPIFHYAPRLLEYFGAENLQKIACLTYILRVVAYTLIPNGHVIFVLLFEPLHGVTYACSTTSAVEFASRLSPTGYESSGQGFLSLITGIGSVVGLSMGGWIEEVLGPKVLYRSYAAIVTFGLGIFYLTIFIDNRRRDSNPSKSTTQRYSHLSTNQIIEDDSE